MMVERQPGSGLLLLFMLLFALTAILGGLYIRTTFILRTVVERESYLKWRCATESLACYAISLAKSNWHMLCKQLEKEPLVELILPEWPIDEKKRGEGHIKYKRADHTYKEKALAIQVCIEDENIERQVVHCSIKPVKKQEASNEIEKIDRAIDQVEILQWRLS